MSTSAFPRLEAELIADEQEREDLRVERLAGAGKLCAACFATTIERETSEAGSACFRCLQCGARWLA